MDALIGKRLKEFRTRTGRKMSAISIATGIKTDTLYKWEKGTRPSNVAEYHALLQYLDRMESVQENWFLNEPGSQAIAYNIPKPAFMRLSLRHPGKPVPVNNGNVSPGTVTLINDEPQLIVDFLEAPFLGLVEGVIDVVGDSMSPTFKSGSKVAIVRLQDPTILNWGEYYYIIDKNLQGLVRRVGPDKTDNSIVLMPDNPDTEKYPPIIRRWEQIVAIFKVMANICRL
jgi:hypothetical protein